MLFGRAICENPFKSVMNTRTKKDSTLRGAVLFGIIVRTRVHPNATLRQVFGGKIGIDCLCISERNGEIVEICTDNL